MSKVGKWESGKPQTFFEKIWKNPCTIQKKIVPLHQDAKRPIMH